MFENNGMTVTIPSAKNCYEITFYSNIFNCSINHLFAEYDAILIVSDKHLDQLDYPDQIRQKIQSRTDQIIQQVILPAGESAKTLASVQQIYQALIENHYGRNSLILAFGGGCISDVSGYVAATFFRGVDWISVPTTLLSQVDAAIGGKTAINYQGYKNVIGAFWQPKHVLLTPYWLSSLDQCHIANGMAEVIKYACIFDKTFFHWLKQSKDQLTLADNYTGPWLELIYRCVKWKVNVVQLDATEQHGQRILLNFGHTFGHALESLYLKQGLLHGQAVAIGMGIAAYISYRLGMLEWESCQALFDLLRQYHLSIQLPVDVTAQQLVEKMRLDKKNFNRRAIVLILLKDIGHGVVVQDIDVNTLTQWIDAYQKMI